MQFFIKTVLAVAIGMATFGFAAPQATVDAVPITAEAAAPAESSVTVTEINSSASSTITEVVPAPSDPQLKFRCCAFTGCKVCADYGQIHDCSPCGGAYPWCCASP